MGESSHSNGTYDKMGVRGFTLMEVCVALAVLMGAVIVFGFFFTGFRREYSLEQEKARAFIESLRVVEELVHNPPLCRDSAFVRNGVNVVLKAVPGVQPLAWVRCELHIRYPVRLRRLVRCKRK